MSSVRGREQLPASAAPAYSATPAAFGPAGLGQPDPQQWTPPGQPQWTPGQQQWSGQPSYQSARRFAGFWADSGAGFIDGLILSPFGIVGQIVLTNGKQELRTCGFDSQLVCESPAGST